MRSVPFFVLTFLTCIVVSGGLLQCAAAPPEETTAIRGLVVDAAKSREHYNRALQAIEVYPPGTTVAATVHLLRHDRAFTERSVRRTAYEFLRRVNGSSFDLGCEQLLACLQEHSFRSVCASALWTASPKRA